jgi:cytochrome P450
MKNPRVLDKVQEEIRNLGGAKDFLEECDLQNLPYLNAVIKETLRLHLPAPLLLSRESRENCTISGYNIPAKTILYVNAWAIQRDHNVWENAEEFYPERFLESSINFTGQDFELIPLPMAVASLKLILANLLYSFDWKLPHGLVKEDIDTETLPGITQHKKNPLCLVAKIPM